MQTPDFTQSYNRYSYALNNPLKYTDPSGEIAWLPFAMASAILAGKFYHDGYKANNNNLNPTQWNWKNVNFAVGFGNTNGGWGGYIGAGWGNDYSVNIGINAQRTFKYGYSLNGHSYMAMPLYVPTDPAKQIALKEKEIRDISLTQSESNWATGVLAFITADIAMPEPTDGAWPKWATYAVAGTAAGAYLYAGDYYEKMEREISGIMQRAKGPQGFQYALVATKNGYYPNVRGGTTYLNIDDVWKYGETTKLDRYSDKYLTAMKLEMRRQFFGNQMEIKIQEKIMIYGYFFQNGTLPPGNRIFR